MSFSTSRNRLCAYCNAGDFARVATGMRRMLHTGVKSSMSRSILGGLRGILGSQIGPVESRSLNTAAFVIPKADFFQSNEELSSRPKVLVRLFSHTSSLWHGSPSSSPGQPPSAFKAHLQLGKPKLTALIVLSTMATYAITPDQSHAIGAAAASLPVPSLWTLLFLTIGTAFTSASANAVNMAREPVYDGMMSRTRSRPIVRGLVSPRQAIRFAILTGITGAAALYFGVNTETAALAVINIALYAGLYTSMKRTSIMNTWVGAVVGAIPPLMGWSAAGGSLVDPGAWCLAGLLYAWQFPHFNALSYPIRDEYKMAGYMMAAWVNPQLSARVALRYSVAIIPLCVGLWYYGVTDWMFVADSTVVNAWLVARAYKFWKECRGTVAGKGATASARRLFWVSIWQLPAVLVLAMIHKRGLWDGMFEDQYDDRIASDTEEAIEELYETE
ncbi:UbiA prenyltransferase family-domain-containing protein [Lipomyces tetrasporus]|uniref:Protoheme IX farnesyltransferase, mitochondrial n=1 Tax=Lipomyces tetrasporus TaxID=54092 RepID=A0AAD7QP88_9ASCO|nr:UbiA prenyltransferase family-domain-containing protein [Lipomyces tetrasporus]KAJ8097307.1 UbiA prenyltransferase family-domain-containing protein [Lipomyces tetrasporus]